MTTVHDLVSRYTSEELESKFKQGYSVVYLEGLGCIWRAPLVYTREDFAKIFNINEKFLVGLF